MLPSAVPSVRAFPGPSRDGRYERSSRYHAGTPGALSARAGGPIGHPRIAPAVGRCPTSSNCVAVARSSGLESPSPGVHHTYDCELLTLWDSPELKAKFVDGVRLQPIAPQVDDRGRLLEFDFSSVPFPVRRAFAITDVPAGVTRGGHRHRGVAQLLFCVAGRIQVELRQAESRHELALTPETGGLYLAPGVWASQRYVVEGTVLVVLASEPFDPASYETRY